LKSLLAADREVGVKHLDYFWLRTTIKITVIVFVFQLLLTVTGVATREPGFEWVIWAAFAGFCAAIAYIVLVARRNRQNATSKEIPWRRQ
jgi:membrane associated rhomboid family serine protease